MSTVTALVPARGGSRRIHRKNLVELAGRPLILHTLDTLSQVPTVDRIVVSTEDPEIAGVCRAHGYEVVDRPLRLADDQTSIDDLTYWWRGQDLGSTLLVVQPTVPLVSATTLAQFIATFDPVADFGSRTMVVPTSHIFWRDVNDDTGFNQEIGVRIYAPGESGRPFATWVMPVAEALDIDTVADLAAARQTLTRRNVVFEFIAGGPVGSGHLHRVLTLAEHLQHHNVHLLYRGSSQWVADLLNARGWDWDWFDPYEGTQFTGLEPGVWVIDTLDTTIPQVADRLAEGWKVVTLEDHGPGVRHADLTVNELYPQPEDIYDRHPHRLLTGSRYAVLRAEFLALPPRTIRVTPEQVLVTFGGTDPANLTERVRGLLNGMAYPHLEVRVITPPGRERIALPRSMAEEMLAADLVITSGGRTVYEAAACGTPTLVLTQNPREATHVHLGRGGNIHLGLGGFVSDERIVRTVRHLLDHPELRGGLAKAGQAALDGKGARRITRKIEDLLEGL